MQFRSLADTPLPTVVHCILRAFEGYFVPMPTEVSAWEQRFARSGANWSRSYGAFEGEELVAFIIHAIGRVDGRLVAFNTGTGVLPAHRGKRLVDALYTEALPHLRGDGVQHCSLEVITRNTAAVRVYERIGFRSTHTWKCFLGTPSAPITSEALHQRDRNTVDLGDDRYYSWDHRMEALARDSGGYALYTVGGAAPWGHVILDPATGRVARLGVADETDQGQWGRLVNALSTFQKPIRLVNVHPERHALISALLQAGLVNDIDQYEMGMEPAPNVARPMRSDR